MKKIFALLLALVLVISASVTVFAAEPSLTASDVTAERGDIVYIAVELAECANANTISIEYEYDSDVLKKVTGKSSWTKEADICDFDITSSKGNWYVEDATNLNGEICKLAFQVKADAPIKATKVKCTVVVKNEQTVVKTLTAEATVTVVCTHEAEEDAVGIKVDATNHKYVCVHCETEILEAHMWDNGKITKVATTKEAGVKTYTCTYCGETKEDEIPKLESDDTDLEDTETEDTESETPDSGNQGGTTTPDSGNQGGTTTPDSGNQGGTTPTPDSGNQGGTTTPDTEEPTTEDASTEDTQAPETEDTEEDTSVDVPETETPDDDQNTSTGGKEDNNILGTVFTVILIIGAIAGGAFYFLKKKR